MPIILNLAVGMPVQCTENVSRALQFANGTIGHVVSFQPSQHDTVQTSTELIVNGELHVRIHSKPPEIVFVKLLGYDDLASIVAGLPPGVVPVQARDKIGICVELPQRSFSIQVCQAPLVPAFSLTSEKCQGLTVEKVIIGPLRHSTRKSPQRSSFYVAVTRIAAVSY